jgi:hypothetical protein
MPPSAPLHMKPLPGDRFAPCEPRPIAAPSVRRGVVRRRRSRVEITVASVAAFVLPFRHQTPEARQGRPGLLSLYAFEFLSSLKARQRTSTTSTVSLVDQRPSMRQQASISLSSR